MLRIVPLLAFLVATPLAARPVTVQGQVLGETGEPLAGASARLVDPLDDRAGEVATTKDDGLFRLVAETPGPYELRIEAPGFAPVVRLLPPLVEDRGVPPATLTPTRYLEVRVTAADGRPVDRARVFVTPGEIGKPAGWRVGTVAGRADAAGRAELPVPAGGELWLEVLAAGHPPQRRQIPAGAGRLDVRLVPGRSVTLSVTGAEGEPRAGVRVELATGLRLGETGDAGRLDAWLPADAATVRAVARDGAWAEVTIAPTPGEGGAGENRPPVELRLVAPHQVEGRVVEAGRGQPLADAWVWQEGAVRAARTDARGAFSLATPFTPPGRLTAVAAGHLSAVVETGGPEVVARLEPAARLHGRLVDPAGRPVAAGSVTVAPTGSLAPPVERASWAWSDGDGRFLLTGLAPHPAWLRVRRDGYVPERLTVSLVPAADPGPLELVLEPALEAVGTVVDGERQPVAGAEIRVLPSVSRRSAEAMLTAGERVIRVHTDGAGRFLVPGVPAGELDVSIHAPGWAPRIVPEVRGTPAAAGTVDLGTFVLEPAVRLEGWVTTPDGEPLSGVAVSAAAAESFGVHPAGLTGGDVEPVTTDGSGAFVVSGLAPGRPVVLRFEQAGWLPVVRSGVVPPTPPLHVEMERSAGIHGRVVDEAGRSVAGAEVVAWQGSGDEERPVEVAATDGEGAFALAGLPAGRLRVVARFQELAGGETGPVELAPGEIRRDVEVELAELAVLTGTVRDAAGEPVSRARLIALAGDGGGLSRPLETTSGGDGTFRLGGLDPGEWSLTVRHPEHLRLDRPVRIGPGEQRLDLVLERGGEIAGRVVTAAGEAAVGAEVRLLPQGGGPAPFPVLAGVDGGFRFAGVGAGSYRLSAELRGATAIRAVELGAAPVAGIELQLQAGASAAGQVLGVAAGELVAGEIVALGPGGAARSAPLSPDGRYRLVGLRAGEWRITARLADGRRASRQVELSAGESLEGADLEIETGYRVTGRVLASGEPAAGALVSVSGAAGAAGGIQTGPDGGFVLPSLPPGTYRLLVLVPGNGAARTVEVEVEGDRDLVIEVGRSS